MKKFISRKSLLTVMGVMLVCFLFTSCADQASVLSTDPYGFFGGLWHGLIFPFSFIGSIFSSDIAVYACDNSGVFYDLGFFLGLGGISFSVGVAR